MHSQMLFSNHIVRVFFICTEGLRPIVQTPLNVIIVLSNGKKKRLLISLSISSVQESQSNSTGEIGQVVLHIQAVT